MLGPCLLPLRVDFVGRGEFGIFVDRELSQECCA